MDFQDEFPTGDGTSPIDPNQTNPNPRAISMARAYAWPRWGRWSLGNSGR